MVDLMKKIALIFGRIPTFDQLRLAISSVGLDVMAGRDELCAHLSGVVEKRAKFNFSVTQDIGVRRAARTVLLEEMLEYVIPVLCSKICTVKRDAQTVCHGLSVSEILFRGTVFCAVVLLPVLHKEAFDSISLLEQQHSGHRRVHTAGHADNDGLTAPCWLTHWLIGSDSARFRWEA